MSEKSKIQWTDATWNPVVGCSRISAGCRNCYAHQLHDMRHKAKLEGKALPDQYLQPFTTIQTMPDRLFKPISWRKPRRIFVNSVSDLFHEDVPDSFIREVFGVMAIAFWHTFQVLTKRPARMMQILNDGAFFESVYEDFRVHRGGSPQEKMTWPLPNVWIGVSVEDQRAADARIPFLVQSPAAVRFLSCEPLLGSVDLRTWLGIYQFEEGAAWAKETGADLDWVIVGGESGSDARPCAIEWIGSLIDQCKAAKVPVFLKQLGTFPVSEERRVTPSEAKELGCHPEGWAWHAGLRDKKGGDIEEWPETLKVREFPEPNVRIDVKEKE